MLKIHKEKEGIMKKVYSFLALLGATAFLSFSLVGRNLSETKALGSDAVPLANIDAWKFGGGNDTSTSYVNEGVQIVVPGADTVEGDAWWHRPQVPNHESMIGALSLDAYGKASITFSVGLYNGDGSEISKSQNSYGFDVAFYKSSSCGDNDQVARVRIWTNSGNALNGSHSTVVYSNGWGNSTDGKWIIGDATLSSSFTIQLDRTNLISAPCNGVTTPVRLAGSNEWVESQLSVLDGVDNVWVRFEGDNGFAKSTTIILKEINGQSLANDGTYFIDNVAPAFLKADVPASITVDEEYEIPTEAFDLLSSVSYSVKIGENVTDGKKFTPTDVGDLAVQLIATDAAGNVAKKDYVFNVLSNIAAPTFDSLPTIGNLNVKALEKLVVDMPEITDSTGTAVVVLKIYKGDVLFATLEKNTAGKFEYVFASDFESGDYKFIFEATNEGGTTVSEAINSTITMAELDSVPFITVPDAQSIAVYSEKGLECKTLNNWKSFYFGNFDFSEGFDFKFIVDDADAMENAAVALHIINADDPNYVAEYRVWTSFSGGDRPTNVYISTNGWVNVEDITDTGWIKRGVDDIENQYHMAYSVEDTFKGERLGGMQQVDRAVEKLKAFFEAAPSANFKAYLSLGKDGAPYLKATISEINGQKFASPITWNNAYLALKSNIPEMVALNSELEIKAYAKDIRQACAIHLGGKNADNEDINVDFVDGVASYTFAKVGNYKLVISTVGANGETVKIEKDVVCKTAIDPIEITVSGQYESTYATGTEITILGATYSENVVSHSIMVAGPNNVAKMVEAGEKYKFELPGLYKITYFAEDDALPEPNEAKKEFVINVPDAENPVITVTGAKTASVNEVISVTVAVEDASDVSVTVTLIKPDSTSEKLTGNNGVYSFTPGSAGKYTIRVVAEDLYGNKETVNHEITVSEKAPTPTPEPEKPAKKGCGGSIIAASAIISSISLVGVALIAIKRKQK